MAYKETGRRIIEKQSETIVEIDIQMWNEEQNYKTIIIIIITMAII